MRTTLFSLLSLSCIVLLVTFMDKAQTQPAVGSFDEADELVGPVVRRDGTYLTQGQKLRTYVRFRKDGLEQKANENNALDAAADLSD